MTTWNVILIVLGVLGVLGYTVYLAFKKYMLAQYEYSLEELKQNLLIKEEELQHKEYGVRNAYQIQAEERMHIDNQRQWIDNVFLQNKDILKKNQMYLYGIKEEMLMTISDYRKACALMAFSLNSDNLEKKAEHLIEMNLKIIAMEDRFISNFRMTPSEYRQVRKINNTNYSSN